MSGVCREGRWRGVSPARVVQAARQVSGAEDEGEGARQLRRVRLGALPQEEAPDRASPRQPTITLTQLSHNRHTHLGRVCELGPG